LASEPKAETISASVAFGNERSESFNERLFSAQRLRREGEDRERAARIVLPIIDACCDRKPPCYARKSSLLPAKNLPVIFPLSPR
jgi:hypothetical protein